MNNFENLAAKKGEKCSAGDVRLSRKLTTWKCADISSQLTTGEKKTKINGKKAPAANRLILHKKEKKKKREKEKDAALVSSSNSRPPPAHLIWRSNILKRECSTVSQSMR